MHRRYSVARTGGTPYYYLPWNEIEYLFYYIKVNPPNCEITTYILPTWLLLQDHYVENMYTHIPQMQMHHQDQGRTHTRRSKSTLQRKTTREFFQPTLAIRNTRYDVIIRTCVLEFLLSTNVQGQAHATQI
jgi:hypothetical protein